MDYKAQVGDKINNMKPRFKRNKVKIAAKEKCNSCGKIRVCATVHVDKDVTEKWCKKCRDEEENINEGLHGFPEVHI